MNLSVEEKKEILQSVHHLSKIECEKKLGDLKTPGEKEAREFTWSRMKDQYKKQFGPKGPYDSKHNIGQILMGEAGAVLRGGWGNNKNNAGIFATNLMNSDPFEHEGIGFRCALSLPENR